MYKLLKEITWSKLIILISKDNEFLQITIIDKMTIEREQILIEQIIINLHYHTLRITIFNNQITAIQSWQKDQISLSDLCLSNLLLAQA